MTSGSAAGGCGQINGGRVERSGQGKAVGELIMGESMVDGGEQSILALRDPPAVA